MIDSFLADKLSVAKPQFNFYIFQVAAVCSSTRTGVQTPWIMKFIWTNSDLFGKMPTRYIVLSLLFLMFVQPLILKSNFLLLPLPKNSFPHADPMYLSHLYWILPCVYCASQQTFQYIKKLIQKTLLRSLRGLQ